MGDKADWLGDGGRWLKREDHKRMSGWPLGGLTTWEKSEKKS